MIKVNNYRSLRHLARKIDYAIHRAVKSFIYNDVSIWLEVGSQQFFLEEKTSWEKILGTTYQKVIKGILSKSDVVDADKDIVLLFLDKDNNHSKEIVFVSSAKIVHNTTFIVKKDIKYQPLNKKPFILAKGTEFVYDAVRNTIKSDSFNEQFSKKFFVDNRASFFETISF
ncbi:MAG: hypothetical protein ACOCQR_02445 [bacterium]